MVKLSAFEIDIDEGLSHESIEKVRNLARM